MDYEEILDNLSNSLTLDSNYNFTQNDIDNILKICKKNNWKEKAWRLALTLGSSKNFNFINYAKYYILERDSYYLSELIYAVINLDLNQIYNLIKETGDETFINEMLEELMIYCGVSTNEDLIIELKKS